MEVLKRLNLRRRPKPPTESLPVVPGFKVLGSLSSGGSVAWPENFEQLTTVKQPRDVFKNILPDEDFGFKPGSAVYVIGRVPKPDGNYDYVLSAHDWGNPVFIADASTVQSSGFDPDKFNFQP